jgi:hypothetical protein
VARQEAAPTTHEMQNSHLPETRPHDLSRVTRPNHGRRIIPCDLRCDTRCTGSIRSRPVELAPSKDRGDFRLSGKTGTVSITPGRELVWLVGYVERGKEVIFRELSAMP